MSTNSSTCLFSSSSCSPSPERLWPRLPSASGPSPQITHVERLETEVAPRRTPALQSCHAVRSMAGAALLTPTACPPTVARPALVRVRERRVAARPRRRQAAAKHQRALARHQSAVPAAPQWQLTSLPITHAERLVTGVARRVTLARRICPAAPSTAGAVRPTTIVWRPMVARLDSVLVQTTAARRQAVVMAETPGQGSAARITGTPSAPRTSAALLQGK